jgi:tripartite-type tricarboxylate transporter receptor subunit TctC
VAKSAPDGYTLVFVPSPALTINPLMYPDLPYKPLSDLVPITLFTTASFVLVVNNAVPARSVQELIAHLRANPGKLNHASNSASTMLVSELFKSLAKVDYMDINYKGGSLAVSDTIAGTTQLAFVNLGSAIPAMESGQLRALAMTNAKRYELQPNLPTLAEAGVPGFSALAWNIVLAPARTPPDIVAKVHAALLQVLRSPEVLKDLETNGNEVVGARSEEAVRILRADTEKWARLVKERNIRLQ